MCVLACDETERTGHDALRTGPTGRIARFPLRQSRLAVRGRSPSQTSARDSGRGQGASSQANRWIRRDLATRRSARRPARSPNGLLPRAARPCRHSNFRAHRHKSPHPSRQMNRRSPKLRFRPRARRGPLFIRVHLRSSAQSALQTCKILFPAKTRRMLFTADCRLWLRPKAAMCDVRTGSLPRGCAAVASSCPTWCKSYAPCSRGGAALPSGGRRSSLAQEAAVSSSLVTLQGCWPAEMARTRGTMY